MNLLCQFIEDKMEFFISVSYWENPNQTGPQAHLKQSFSSIKEMASPHQELTCGSLSPQNNRFPGCPNSRRMADSILPSPRKFIGPAYQTSGYQRATSGNTPLTCAMGTTSVGTPHTSLELHIPTLEFLLLLLLYRDQRQPDYMKPPTSSETYKKGPPSFYHVT